jgi:DNA-binding IclR family transcriptional regulator
MGASVVNSLLKAIKIMHLFDASASRLSLAEISSQVGIPKSTAHSLLKTLHSEGYIEKVGGDLYALGIAPLVLTQNIRVNVEIRDPAAPLLRELADSIRQSVYLTIKDGDYALYIYAIESPQRLLARTAVGDRVPLHCTSAGKAILSLLTDGAVKDIVTRVGLHEYTENTITDLDALQRDLESTRSRGYAIDRAEHEIGTYCIGAPVVDELGHVIGSCSISGADPEIVGTRLLEMAKAIRYTAQEISRRMGYVPARPSSVAPPPSSPPQEE